MAKKDKVKIFAGRYAYVKPLGRGAGGSVYLAEDIRVNRRQVALKVLTPEAYATVQGKMLRREFEILSKLDHANLVRVYDYGRLPDGGVFLAEEYIDGFSLQDARALLDPSALIGATLQILDGLAYLHGMGMIHRDIKPANVMLLWLDDASVEPMVKLVDFGLSSMDPQRDTLRGGTRSYMAPEIIRGEKGAPQSDMFSLGVTLYYALCGVLPFGPRTKDDPPPTEEDFRPPEPHRLNPEVPLALSRFTMALLRQLPDVEYVDAGEAMQALARDVQDTSSIQVGRFANSLDTSAPQILRGYFERGILQQQFRDHDFLVRHLNEQKGLMYLIGGEAATGKSRLLREVETSLKLGGRLVISVACEEGKETPWGLLSRILEHLLLHAKRHDPGVVDKYRESKLILDELVTGRSQTLLIERQERWLYRAWRELALALERDHPVLFIEDLHLADESSISFLRDRFEAEEPEHGIDVVVSCLPDERVRELVNLAGVEPIINEGLQAEDVEHLIYERMKLEDIGFEWIERVSELAKGKPAYLLEVCRSLVDQGALWRESAQHWGVDPVQLEMFTLPSTLRESFRRRLNLIGASGRELLEMLTLLNRPIEWSMLRKMAVAGGESDDNVDRAIETLRFRHLVRIELEMSGRYVSLIHEEVKRVVEMLISPEWQRALHRRIGDVLEAQWKLEGGDAEEVTHHMSAGGQKQRAALMAWGWAQGALENGDWRSSSRALDIARSTNHSTSDSVLIEIEHARSALALFEREECLGALERALEQAEESALDWLTYHASTSAAEIAWGLRALDESAKYLENLRDVLPVMAQQPRYLESRARLEFARGEMDRAKKTLQSCNQRFSHFGNPVGMLSSASALATLAGVQGDAQAAGEMLQQAYDLATEHDLRLNLGESLLIHAQLMRLGNEPVRALDLLNDALEAMSGGTYAAHWFELLIEFSCTYEAMSEYAGAEQRAIEALLLARRLENVAGDALATLLVSDLATRRKVVEGLEREAHLSRMREAWGKLSEQQLFVHWKMRGARRFGHVLERFGEEEEAAKMFEEGARLSKIIGAEHHFAHD